jgi:hypothetical protein
MEISRTRREKRSLVAVVVLLLVLAAASLPSLAQTLLRTIEGSCSDGSNAPGSGIRLRDDNANTLCDGDPGQYSFVESAPMPMCRPCFVVFDAEPGHVVTKEDPYPSSLTVEKPCW